MPGEIHFPDGFFGEYGAGAAPTTPTLSVSVSGTTATATIDGDADATNYLVYKAASDTGWTDGGNRAGDGDLVVAGLSAGVRYTFMAYSIAYVGYSAPSITIDILIQVTTTSVQNGLLLAEADAFLAAFGEPVTYYPKGGGSRDIVAVVDRNPVAGLTGAPHGNTPRMLVIVKNDSDEGISSSEVNRGGDKVGLPVEIGATAQQRRINAISWHDYGMVHLEVG